MCIKDVLWNLIPTCWMAAKFGSARTFCCFTPSAQSCIQFLNVHKNCKSLKMPDWNNKNFESHSATVLGFLVTLWEQDWKSWFQTYSRIELLASRFGTSFSSLKLCLFSVKQVHILRCLEILGEDKEGNAQVDE